MRQGRDACRERCPLGLRPRFRPRGRQGRTLGKDRAQVVERSGREGGERPASGIPDEGHHSRSECAAKKGLALRNALGDEVVERLVAPIPGRPFPVDDAGVQSMEPGNRRPVRPPRPAHKEELLHRDPREHLKLDGLVTEGGAGIARNGQELPHPPLARECMRDGDPHCRRGPDDLPPAKRPAAQQSAPTSLPTPRSLLWSRRDRDKCAILRPTFTLHRCGSELGRVRPWPPGPVCLQPRTFVVEAATRTGPQARGGVNLGAGSLNPRPHGGG